MSAHEVQSSRRSAPRVRAFDSRAAEKRITCRATQILAGSTRGAADRPSLSENRDLDSESLLRRAIELELAKLREAGVDGAVSPVEQAQLVADLQDLYFELRELRLQQRVERHERMQESFARMRNVGDPEALLDGVTRELCFSCGFERGVLSRIEGSEWVLSGAHFEEHDQWAKAFVQFGSQARPTLTHTLLEAQISRRRAPALVTDAKRHPFTHKPFVQFSHTRDYVSAPILPRGRVIGFFHADYHFSGNPVDEVDRDTLWAFAAGFAYVFERAVLLERLREQQSRFGEMVSSTAAAVETLCDSHVVSEDPARERTMIRDRIAALVLGDTENPMALTRREVEVLSLMATGATNAVIARELFISVGTVKSHVKRILRKLDASNRAEAVSRYLRGKAPQTTIATAG